MEIKINLTRQANKAKWGSSVAIDLEEYLRYVVNKEIGGTQQLAALKAQAIASRSYAIAMVEAGVTMDDTTKYQAFEVKDISNRADIQQAIRDTAGMILYCDGKPATAWFGDGNDGRTKSSEEKWGGIRKWTIAQDDPWDGCRYKNWVFP